tara:strand:- start:26919 stop:27230 length:312 start_codon:yes stop_codon:yes gene_type:complete
LGKRDSQISSACQKRIKFAGTVEGGQIVRPSDMAVVYKYLGHGCPATGALDHFRPFLPAHCDVSLFETYILFFEQGLGPEAETAGKFCIYFNFRHVSIFLPSL